MINIKKIELKDEEDIKGGAVISVWTGIVISALLVFISGIIEGIVNPERCNG